MNRKADQYNQQTDEILAAAEALFLAEGFERTNMDAVAARAGVAKQTIYRRYPSKEVLFVDVVSRAANTASDAVHRDQPLPPPESAVADYLESYLVRQLCIVMTPRIIRLRRLAIGEANRFPALARALYEGGPKRAIEALAAVIHALARRGDLTAKNPLRAAEQLNWLVMSGPLNQAMLLGDDAIAG